MESGSFNQSSEKNSKVFRSQMNVLSSFSETYSMPVCERKLIIAFICATVFMSRVTNHNSRFDVQSIQFFHRMYSIESIKV